MAIHLGWAFFISVKGRLIGNITLSKHQNAHRLSLNINRPTRRLKINPNRVGQEAISFSWTHTSTARNKRGRGPGVSTAIHLHLYHTEITSIILTRLPPPELIYYRYNCNVMKHYWQTKRRGRNPNHLERCGGESCGQKTDGESIVSVGGRESGGGGGTLPSN